MTNSKSTAELQAYNPNYIGGDIIGGANDRLQVLFRPRVAIDPYFTGVPGVYLCSQSTPPGAGIHGLCGYHAAQSAFAPAGQVSQQPNRRDRPRFAAHSRSY
jgi:phytoene dehydrogenase-like protein